MEEDHIQERAGIVIEHYSGIVPYNEAFYLSSLLYSAEMSLSSFRWYEENKLHANAETLISTLQEGIGHAAALSRYFWPSLNHQKKRKTPIEQLRYERGQKLCRSFQLNSNSPLKNRSLRNAWEHFDERLDRYLLGLDAGMIFPECNFGDHRMVDESQGHIFKMLDREHSCLVLMNEKYFFKLIQAEVEVILDKALLMYKKGARLA